MSQFNVTTTGLVPVVTIEDLHLTLTHPQTIDLRNDLVEEFSWAEILESDDLQAAIDAGEVNATDISANPISAVTLDRLATSATGIVQDTIVDGVTNIAPSQNAVFDALALKLDASAVSPFGLTLIDDTDAATARTTLGLGTAAVEDVSFFATAAQGTLADTAVQPGDNVSDLTNDAGYLTSVTGVTPGDLATVATTGDYNDLINLPALGTAAFEDTTFFATAAQGTLADSALQPGGVDNVSELINDAGYITAATAPVLDVFGRTGNVVAAASDYDDSQVDLTYTPTNFIATNAFLDGALEGIDNALGAITGDGNDTPVVRGNATQGVAPSGAEVPSPILGDTASVYLTDGTLEKWAWDGSTWLLAYTLAPGGGTNLGYTPSPTNGTITSDTGSDAIIPLANTTNAGLLAPADFDKLGFITVTQPVDLDDIETNVDALITLSGLPAGSTDLGTFTGSTITDNSSVKDALQELETAVENVSVVYGSDFNFFQSLPVSTTTSTTFQSKISGSTTALAGGTYKIIISYSWNHNATQTDFESRLLFDGSPIGQNVSGLIHKQEPKDSAGNWNGTGSSQQHTFTQIYYVAATAGVKTIDLSYRTDSGNNQSSIWDASIEIVRVQ